MPFPTVSFVVPDGIDDPARPSGGNAYDRRICAGLRAQGWDVREVGAAGPWPRPDAAALEHLAGALDAVPDGSLVLVDGLVASAAGSVLVPEAARLRLVVLVHLPLGGMDVPEEDEARVFGCAAVVVTTSAWTRQRLLDRYGLASDRVAVARPGADLLEEEPGSCDGGRFLCVGAVAAHKGHDVLVEGLARIADRAWTCTVAGALDREPAFVEALSRRAADAGIADRIRWTGPLAGGALGRQYRSADLLVLPSRVEAYGMVVTEALGAGVPVVATAVGGVPEALGGGAAGPPGRLVPPDDPGALAAALAAWLDDADLRAHLRRAARDRRRSLEGWDRTAATVAAVLAGIRDAGAVGAGA
jgi:glycosyltransferase involved in cell wall biosynthesis